MNFVRDERRMLYNVMLENQDASTVDTELTFELAGPREYLYFNPEKVTSAVVTCGGLCPGLNDVIRSIVMESYYRYGAKKIYGIRYGYNGLNPAKGYEPIELKPDVIRDIHMDGGTMLGSSRVY
jgi:6-phosphofructokinase 1